jgi:hypothetical protein
MANAIIPPVNRSGAYDSDQSEQIAAALGCSQSLLKAGWRLRRISKMPKAKKVISAHEVLRCCDDRIFADTGRQAVPVSEEL